MRQIVKTSKISPVLQAGIAAVALALPISLQAQDIWHKPSYADGFQNRADYVEEARGRYTNPYVAAGAKRAGGTFRLAPGEALATSGEYMKQFFGGVWGKAKSLGTRKDNSGSRNYTNAHRNEQGQNSEPTKRFSPRSLLPSFGSAPNGQSQNPTGHGDYQQAQSRSEDQFRRPEAPSGEGRVSLNHRGPLPEPVVRSESRRQVVWAPKNNASASSQASQTKKQTPSITRLPIEPVTTTYGQTPQPPRDLPVPPKPVTASNPDPGPRPNLEAAAPDDGYLVGTASGKPGRVLSPYPPHQELDVTGIASGDLAIDPVANKIFRLP